MAMVTKIKMLLAKRDMTQKELAEKMGVAPGNLSRKFINNNLTEKDIVKIAELLGCDFVGNFVDKETKEVI